MNATPGPWKVRLALYIGRAAYFVDPARMRSPHDSICVAVIRERWPVSEAEANAHLIAAAPDMLDALRECMEDAERQIRADAPGVPPDWYASVKAAIARAEGRDDSRNQT